MGNLTESFFGNTRIEAYGGITNVQARGGVSGVVIVGATIMTVSGLGFVRGVSWLDKDEIKVVGDDSLSSGTTLDFLEYKDKLYMAGFGYGFTLNFSFYNEADGKWTQLVLDQGIAGSGARGLVLWNDWIICLGPFTSIFGLSFNDPWARGGIAWDGSQFLTIGLDNSSPWLAVASFPSQGVDYNGLLIASGSNVIRKTATATIGSWVKLFAGDTDPAGSNNAMIKFGDLVAFAGVGFIKTWLLDDTAYTAIGTPTGANAVINTMVQFKGDLIVAGSFTAINGVSAENVARWNGTEWFAMGSGVDSTASADVRTMLVDFDGALLIGGSFTKDGDGNTLDSLAIWNGSQFVNAAPNYIAGTPNSMGIYSGEFEL